MIERLTMLGIRRRLQAGEVLFLKGDDSASAYALLSDRIRISVTAPDGREVALATMEPGDLFGEIGVLDGKPRSADAIARLRSETLVVRREALLKLLDADPELSARLLELMCERIRRTTMQVEDSIFACVPARLARRVLDMAGRHGTSTAAGVEVDLQSSQRELGVELGVSRVTVNEHLQRRRDQGWVALTRGHIRVLNIAALRALAEQ